MDTDTRKKKAAIIDRSFEVREHFFFAHPMLLRAVRLYCCDHYDSMLRDLEGNMDTQYFNVWNTCVKLTWGITRVTNTYFLDYLSDIYAGFKEA